MLATRNVWFPLASNASYFDLTEPRVGLEARVKQMAILADEVFFEPGALAVSVGENGLVNWYREESKEMARTISDGRPPEKQQEATERTQ